jgi:hypothetical protein
MSYFKAQTTIEYTGLLVLSLALAALAIGFFISYFSQTTTQVSQTTLIGIQQINFYPFTGQAPNATNYLGDAELTIYSTNPVSINSMYLVQTMNSSTASNCPSVVKFTNFPTNGLTCISLGMPVKTFPEGNNNYLLYFNSVLYNGTAFSEMNNTNGAFIKYAILSINGKYEYTKLNPQLPIIIS